MHILAFAASSSKKSINKQLVTYAASLLDNHQVDIIDLNDFELPLFSEDKEQELGQPEQALAFLKKIKASDALLISFAEHNGSYSAAYKNLFDWVSRIDHKVYQNKPMVLLSTSPGARGGTTVLNLAKESASRFSGQVVASLSVPSFYDNFDQDKQSLKESALRDTFEKTVLSINQPAH